MSRQARLGLIMLAGVIAFIGALFVLANRSFLLSDTYTVRAQFNRVAGLQGGATVFYNGISVGRVERVQLPPSPGQPITVTMKIRDNARHLIREDSRAVIQTDGLVGNVIVALTDGTAARPTVEENGFITGVDPLDLSQFSTKALESVQRFDSVTVTLTQIMQDVQRGEGTLGQFLYDERLYEEFLLTGQETRASMRALTGRADALVGVAQQASDGMNSIIQQVQYGDGTISRFLNEDSVYVAFLQASDQFSTISADLSTLTQRFENAAGWASLGAFRFAENMEALKHNFLFKPYFEERGYLEMAPFEIRERALAETFGDLQERERLLLEEERRLEAIRADLRQRGLLPPEALTPRPAAPGTPATTPTGGTR